LAVLVLVAAIAFTSQLVRTDDAATNRPTAATAPATTPTPTVAPAPEIDSEPNAPSPDAPDQTATGVPTPGGFADTTLSPLAHEAASLAATEPSLFLGAAVIDSHLMVPGNGGVWVKAQLPHEEWSFVAQPPELQDIACSSVIADKMVFTARNSDRTSQHIAALDVATKQWSVTRLPRLDEDREAQRRPDYCEGIVVDGAWVFGRYYEGVVYLAVSDDQGSTFRLRSIALPGSGTTEISTLLAARVELAAGDGEFVAKLCLSLNYETRSGVNAWTFPNAIIAEEDSTTIEWADAGGVSVRPSPRYDGSWTASGMPGDTTGIAASPLTFDVQSAGGKLWRSELIEAQTMSTNLVEDFEAGLWAVGPVGQPTVPLPAGFRPRLFAYGDGLVAEVPVLARDLDGIATTPQWWVLDDGATAWRQLQRSPVVEWFRLPPDTPVSVALVDSSSTFVIPTTPPPEP